MKRHPLDLSLIHIFIFTIPEGITPDTQDGADPNTITINNNYALGADAAPVLIVFDVP